MSANHPDLYEQELAVRVDTFVQTATKALDQILDDSGTNLLGESGSILYSSCCTLTNGYFYFLGLNPSGSQEDRENSIQKSLINLPNQTENAFLDEVPNGLADWNGRPGQAPYQIYFQDLFRGLGVKDLHGICASNLIF